MKINGSGFYSCGLILFRGLDLLLLVYPPDGCFIWRVDIQPNNIEELFNDAFVATEFKVIVQPIVITLEFLMTNNKNT
jgi:hypothetical protein